MAGKCCHLCPCPCNEYPPGHPNLNNLSRPNGPQSPSPNNTSTQQTLPSPGGATCNQPFIPSPGTPQSTFRPAYESTPLSHPAPSPAGLSHDSHAFSHVDQLSRNELLILRRKLQACELRCNILEEKIALLRQSQHTDFLERLRLNVIRAINAEFDKVRPASNGQ
ncbi:hypothetical protein HDE_03752 [Halotydeus destructor]|nr:hypothetical protein HDE_03752 [Halotydeus destructor]